MFASGPNSLWANVPHTHTLPRQQTLTHLSTMSPRLTTKRPSRGSTSIQAVPQQICSPRSPSVARMVSAPQSVCGPARPGMPVRHVRGISLLQSGLSIRQLYKTVR